MKLSAAVQCLPTEGASGFATVVEEVVRSEVVKILGLALSGLGSRAMRSLGVHFTCPQGVCGCGC